MSENNNNGEKKWYQMKPSTKAKLKQLGLVLSGVLLYAIYQLQPALQYAINDSTMEDVWKIYLTGLTPVVLMALGSAVVILFSLQGEQSPQPIGQQIGTPQAQMSIQTPQIPQAQASITTPAPTTPTPT